MKFNNIEKKTWIFENLVFIIPLKVLRNTPEVEFYSIPEVIKNLSAIDKVIHKKGAKSPRIKGDSNHYWYMHPNQEDQLIVHDGKRVVELYSKKHNKLEKFEVTAKHIKYNGKVIYSGPAILGWPRKVFHRISSPNGSISTNYAKHYTNFDLKTNFNIYKLNVESGEYEVIREGPKDQPKYEKHPSK